MTILSQDTPLDFDQTDKNLDATPAELTTTVQESEARLVEESQTMDDAALSILNDQMALSLMLKNQYESVAKRND